MKRILVVGALLAVTAFGCGGDDDSADRGKLVKTIAEESGISESEAECIIDKIEGEVDLKALADGEPNKEDTDAVLDATLDCVDIDGLLEEG